MKTLFKVTMGLLFFAGFSMGCRQKAERCLYMDTTVNVEKRIDDLLERMTLQEKIAQLQFIFPGNMDSLKTIRPGHIFGIGSDITPVLSAKLYDEMQKKFESTK